MLGAKDIFYGETYTGSVFFSSALESVTIPSMLKEMLPHAFDSCCNLKTVRVAKGCKI